MNIKEIGDVFHCDCGFSWSRGKNGNHNCANGLREKVRQLAAENVGLKKFIQTECFVGHLEPETFYEEEVTRYVSADGYEPETPATDRIVAGIKADGVEEFAAHLLSMECHLEATWAKSFVSEVLNVKGR